MRNAIKNRWDGDFRFAAQNLKLRVYWSWKLREKIQQSYASLNLAERSRWSLLRTRTTTHLIFWKIEKWFWEDRWKNIADIRSSNIEHWTFNIEQARNRSSSRRCRFRCSTLFCKKNNLSFGIFNNNGFACFRIEGWIYCYERANGAGVFGGVA